MSRVQMLLAAQCREDASLLGVPRLMQATRRTMADLGISGALLFDGETLVQLIEGGLEVVQPLATYWLGQRLLFDARVSALCDPPCSHLNRPWQAGFVEPDVLNGVLSRCTPTARVEEFISALRLADVQ